MEIEIVGGGPVARGTSTEGDLHSCLVTEIIESMLIICRSSFPVSAWMENNNYIL